MDEENIIGEDALELNVVTLLRSASLTLGLAESVTAGLISSRLCRVPGISSVFRGAVVPYHRDLKSSLLTSFSHLEPQVAQMNVVSKEMVLAMASGVCRLLKSDVGLATTGVAGPDPLEEVDPGNVWVGLWLDGVGRTQKLCLPSARNRVRDTAATAALELLRMSLVLRSCQVFD